MNIAFLRQINTCAEEKINASIPQKFVPLPFIKEQCSYKFPAPFQVLWETCHKKFLALISFGSKNVCLTKICLQMIRGIEN